MVSLTRTLLGSAWPAIRAAVFIVSPQDNASRQFDIAEIVLDDSARSAIDP